MSVVVLITWHLQLHLTFQASCRLQKEWCQRIHSDPRLATSVVLSWEHLWRGSSVSSQPTQRLTFRRSAPGADCNTIVIGGIFGIRAVWLCKDG